MNLFEWAIQKLMELKTAMQAQDNGARDNHADVIDVIAVELAEMMKKVYDEAPRSNDPIEACKQAGKLFEKYAKIFDSIFWLVDAVSEDDYEVQLTVFIKIMEKEIPEMQSHLKMYAMIMASEGLHPALNQILGLGLIRSE